MTDIMSLGIGSVFKGRVYLNISWFHRLGRYYPPLHNLKIYTIDVTGHDMMPPDMISNQCGALHFVNAPYN
jgi:hypothetical protein